jgi:hypothetical protein
MGVEFLPYTIYDFEGQEGDVPRANVISFNKGVRDFVVVKGERTNNDLEEIERRRISIRGRVIKLGFSREFFFSILIEEEDTEFTFRATNRTVKRLIFGNPNGVVRRLARRSSFEVDDPEEVKGFLDEFGLHINFNGNPGGGLKHNTNPAHLFTTFHPSCFQGESREGERIVCPHPDFYIQGKFRPSQGVWCLICCAVCPIPGYGKKRGN